MNNGQEAFRRLVVQLRSSGGGRGGGPGRGAFAGGGLVALLAGGAMLVNASLFNGASNLNLFDLSRIVSSNPERVLTVHYSRWWSQSYQVQQVSINFEQWPSKLS